ncbi:MAG: hypothetical protein R3F48_14980 [Candidatus Zixiibacteriota bacterium]
MVVTLWEILLTIIDSRPHKFAIKKQSEISEDDFRRDIVRVYSFQGTGQAVQNNNINFLVKVTEETVRFHFWNNDMALHNYVIAFGLYSIRKTPQNSEFVLTTDEYRNFLQLPIKEGPELRYEILEFIYTVNSYWPDECISPVNLQDNLIGNNDQSGKWLNTLEKQGLLIQQGFREHSRARGKADTAAYCIRPEAIQDVLKEMSVQSMDMSFHNNKFYKLVDLEVERKGPFAFVIMPFKKEEFDQSIYNDLIKPVVENTIDCKCIRNDEDVWPGQLDDKFYSHICKCNFLIAELTTENPNVVYELGLAHAFNKEIIILVDKKKREKKLSFDFDKFGAIMYSTIEELQTCLADTVKSLGIKLGIPCKQISD